MSNLEEVFSGKATKNIYNGIQMGSGGAGNAGRIYDNRGEPIVRDGLIGIEAVGEAVAAGASRNNTAKQSISTGAAEDKGTGS